MRARPKPDPDGEDNPTERGRRWRSPGGRRIPLRFIVTQAVESLEGCPDDPVERGRRCGTPERRSAALAAGLGEPVGGP